MLIPEARFRWVWRKLCRTWHLNGHCFIRGCGRETVAWWVRESCHVLIPAWECRTVLIEAIQRGWVTKHVNSSGHSIFKLMC